MKKNITRLLIGFSFITLCAMCNPIDETEPSFSPYSEETIKLRNKLKSISKEGIMVGHQDALAFGANWSFEEGRSDIKEVCGDYPAVFGWDLGVMTIKGTPGWTYPVPLDKLREYIVQVNNWGGVNIITAHINNPVSGGSSWDMTKAVHTILPDGNNHELYIKWLDDVAEFFLSLKDSNGKLIPVIFRPFHEHNGSWFWWGRNHCTVGEYTLLWRSTVDYLRNTKKVNNVLYAYSTDKFTTESEYMERYPGNPYVDILGFDTYHTSMTNAEYISSVRNSLSILQRLAESRDKIYAITEIGQRNITNSQWWTSVLYPAIEGFDLSHVLIWRNKNLPDDFYAPYKGHSSADDFLLFKNKPEIFFLQDIKNEISENK